MMRERIPLLSNESLRSPSQFIIFGLNKYISLLLKCWFAFVFNTTSFTFTLAAGTASSIAQWQSAGFECGRFRVQSPVKDRLLDSLVVECWLRVWELPGSIPNQGPRHTKDVIKMVPVVLLFSTERSKGKILALSQELKQENTCNG